MQNKIESIFSLLFFFISSFLSLTILSSVFMDNFDNLIPIMLKPNGFFITITRILIFCGFCIFIYVCLSNYNNKHSRFNKFAIFGILLLISLFILSIVSSKTNDELENVLDFYSYKESYMLFNDIKKLIIDSIIFICFVMFPIIRFFYKKRICDSYFYQTYIKEISPSLNVSIICLFGYIIQVYHLQDIYSIVDLIVSICSITLIATITFGVKQNITFYTFMNVLVLVCGFIVILLSNNYIAQSNTYNASSLFYTIGILYWQFNTLSKLYRETN